MLASVANTPTLPCTSPVAGKPILARFEGDLLSSGGGLLGLHAVEQRLAIARRLAACIDDPHTPGRVIHGLDETTRFRMLMIAAGYEDGNYADRLRADRMFKLAMERLPEAGDLCSQATISRTENLPGPRALLRMGLAIVEHYWASFRSVPNRIVLDIDDTFDAAHGAQQLCLFNAHHDEYGFQPIVVFDGDGRMVAAVLRPACRSKGAQIVKWLRRLIDADHVTASGISDIGPEQDVDSRQSKLRLTTPCVLSDKGADMIPRSAIRHLKACRLNPGLGVKIWREFLFGLIGVIAGLLTYSPADAQAVASPGSTVLMIHHHITWFQGSGDTLKLEHEISSDAITIPEPYNKTFVRVTLHLRGISSPSLMARRSSILVSVNGSPASTINLDGSQPVIDQTITLPGKLFGPGYNIVALRAVQTTGQICEKFDEPSLWTRIAPRSTVTIQAVPRRVGWNLAQLGRVFDKHSLTADEHVTILYNKLAGEHPGTIIAAAQGLARLYDYVPVKIDAEPLTPQRSTSASTSTQPVVMLTPDPSTIDSQNMTRAELVAKSTPAGSPLIQIRGSWQSVVVAARLLGEQANALPHSDAATISILQRFARHKILAPNGSDRSLLDLRKSTSTLVGPNVEFGPIKFWNNDWGGRALITAHLVYGAGGAPDNLLGVYVNGIFVGSVPLNRPLGGIYTDYKIAVPADILVPGKNVLVFRGVLRHQPVHGGECTSEGYSKGIPVTLFDDSSIRITGGSRLVPDNLAELTYADIVPHRLLVADNSPAILSAAATLAAKIAQTDPGVTLSASMLTPNASLGGSMIIGKLVSIPAKIIQKTGIQKIGIVSSDSGSEQSGIKVHIQNDANRSGVFSPNLIPRTRSIVAISSRQDVTYVAMIPAGQQGAILVTARTGTSLQSGVDTLVGWSHWSQLSGDVATVEPGAKTLQVAPADLKVENIVGRVGYFATRNIIIALLGFLTLLAITVLVVRKALNRRYAARNRPGTGQGDAS